MKQEEAIKNLSELKKQALNMVGTKPFSQAHTRWQFNLTNTIRDIFGSNSMYQAYLSNLTYSLRGTAYLWSYDERHEIDQKWFDEDLERAAGVIESAIDEVKEKGVNALAAAQPKVCFLSYKFSEQGKKYGLIVKEFLEGQRVNVLTGEQFQPTSVKEKMEGKLEQAQFGVAIVGEGQQTIWSRDEVLVLKQEKKYVIFLVETGTKFEEGLFADTEYIPFEPGQITQTFTKLVQGIEFIKKQLAKSAS